MRFLLFFVVVVVGNPAGRQVKYATRTRRMCRRWDDNCHNKNFMLVRQCAGNAKAATNRLEKLPRHAASTREAEVSA